MFPLFKKTSPESNKKTSPESGLEKKVNNLFGSESESHSRSIDDEFRFENPYQKKLEQIIKPYTVVTSISNNSGQIPENTILLTFEKNGNSEGKRHLKYAVGNGTKIDTKSLEKLLQSLCKRTSTETEILDKIENDKEFKQLVIKEIKQLFPKTNPKNIFIKIRDAMTFNPKLQKIEEDAVDLVYVKSGNKEAGQWHLLTPTENFPALHEQIAPSHSLHELLYAKKLKEENKLDNELKGTSTKLDVNSLSKLLQKLSTPLTEKEILNTIADTTFQELVRKEVAKLISGTDPTKILIKTVGPNTFDPTLQQIKEKDAAILIYEQSGDKEKAGKWHLIKPTKNLPPVHKQITSTHPLYDLLFTKLKEETEIDNEIKTGAFAKRVEEQVNTPKFAPELSRIKKEEIFVDGERVTIVLIYPKNLEKKSHHYNIIHNNYEKSFVEELKTKKAEYLKLAEESDEIIVLYDSLGTGCNNKRSEKEYSDEAQVKCAQAVHNFVLDQTPGSNCITLTGTGKSAAIFAQLRQNLKDETNLVSLWPSDSEDYKKACSRIPKGHYTPFIMEKLESNIDEKIKQSRIINFNQRILRYIEKSTPSCSETLQTLRTLCMQAIKQYDPTFLSQLHAISKDYAREAQNWDEISSNKIKELSTRNLSAQNLVVINRWPLIEEAINKWLQKCELLINEKTKELSQNFNKKHSNCSEQFNLFVNSYFEYDAYWQENTLLKDAPIRKTGAQCKELKKDDSFIELKDSSVKKTDEHCKEFSKAILTNPLMFPLINKELCKLLLDDETLLEKKSIYEVVSQELAKKYVQKYKESKEVLIFNSLNEELLPLLITEIKEVMKINDPTLIDPKHLLVLKKTESDAELTLIEYRKKLTLKRHEEYEHSQQSVPTLGLGSGKK